MADTQPAADWGYETTPQPGANNVTMHYPRGKMLAGSSARNFMLYHRATVGSYKMWADQVGDDSYTWDKFLPYFEKSMTFTPPNQNFRLANATPTYITQGLADGGPLQLTYPNWAYAFPSWATKVFSSMGMPLRQDGFSAGGLVGHAYATFTIDPKTQIRSSSETAFLRNSLDDPNYTVYTMTNAQKIIFDSTKTATGVKVSTMDSLPYTLTAKKEVILAAGVIGSPQLLQVSGVGPAALLKSLNIPVVADLPGVGTNMQDHIVYGITNGVNLVTASAFGNSPAFTAQQIADFNNKASGAMTSPAADMLAWEKLPNATRSSFSKDSLAKLAKLPADWPEVEYLAFSAYVGNLDTLNTQDPRDGTNYAAFAAVLVAPQSRGTVMIKSPDASVAPVIDPQFLVDKADIDVAVGSFKRMRDMWNNSALKPIKLGTEKFPGAQIKTDAQILNALKGNFQTIFHGSSTCMMGKSSDPKAVVDTKARVYKVKNLRVVDAAAFPFLPPGHPQSTVYALAEKIACNISGNC
ncbi:GMC oxidoreductase [Bombardia bombarda]|uniref:GMC oxidoreductase n=1 Tax=Bombardia bombarda TaxID=252184 RepID=A0AA40CF22_9PEZI|nr:GMC oxidoreductase [Bombardia bombarda]